MKYRAYFKIKIDLLSPLAIGASDSKDTDKDVFLNSKKQPMIPASSIAGVYRSFANEDEQKKYFGDVPINNNDNQQSLEAIASVLKFYDAQLLTSDSTVIPRDSVGLGEDKTAKNGAKFDFQSVETGATFIGYIEVTTKESCKYVKEMLKRQVSFGSKTTRGYGMVKVSYQLKEFDIVKDLEDWLEFDMFGEYGNEYKWIESSTEQNKDITEIVLSLEQKGGLSIRQYSTRPKEDRKKDLPPDYEPLSLKDDTPVIPGTSWAGMFRHNVLKLLGKDYKTEIEEAFGFVKEKDKTSQKSNVWFSESVLEDSKAKILVRNAIDRFTNGTKDGALYTEKTIYDGTTKLVIKLNSKVSDNVISAICATILDLNEGFVAIGGLTSVGRGLFSVTNIHINKNNLDRIDYNNLKAVICNGKK